MESGRSAVALSPPQPIGLGREGPECRPDWPGDASVSFPVASSALGVSGRARACSATMSVTSTIHSELRGGVIADESRGRVTEHQGS